MDNLQYYGEHEEFRFNNRMKSWKEDSDNIVINNTYEFFDINLEDKEGIVTERVNFYSFKLISEGKSVIVPIERFKLIFK